MDLLQLAALKKIDLITKKAPLLELFLILFVCIFEFIFP